MFDTTQERARPLNGRNKDFFVIIILFCIFFFLAALAYPSRFFRCFDDDDDELLGRMLLPCVQVLSERMPLVKSSHFILYIYTHVK